MRVAVVTGGRAYRDRQRVYDTLAAFSPSYVVEGACRTDTDENGRIIGADQFAYDWACETQGVQPVRMPAVWERDDYRGGPIRNEAMMRFLRALQGGEQYEESVVVFAFPGGRGTANAIKKAEECFLTVRRIQ